jgi:hypothetical protein
MINLVPSPKRLNGSLLQPDSQGRKTTPAVSTAESGAVLTNHGVAPVGHHCGARPPFEHVGAVAKGFPQARKLGLDHAIPVHGAMTSRQQSLSGMGHANGYAPDASGPDVFDPTYLNTTKQRPVPIYPGMRSRSNVLSEDVHFALGREVLEQATSVFS